MFKAEDIKMKGHEMLVLELNFNLLFIMECFLGFKSI